MLLRLLLATHQVLLVWPTYVDLYVRNLRISLRFIIKKSINIKSILIPSKSCTFECDWLVKGLNFAIEPLVFAMK